MKRLTATILILFLLSSAAIIYEISLSRLFSYMLSYHFVLIIIAFSILGLGIGQITYSRYFNRIDKAFLLWSASPAAVSLLSFISLLMVSQSGFISTGNTGLLTFVGLSILPFMAIGIVYARLFEGSKQEAPLLYAADLVGAAAGALLSIFLLNALSLGNVFGFAVLLLWLAFVIQAAVQKHRFSSIIVMSFIGILALFWIGKDKLNINVPIANDPSKDMLRLMNNPSIESEIVASRWNAFGKTDLVKLTFPDGAESRAMFIDGAAGTDLVNIDRIAQDTAEMQKVFSKFPAMFAMGFAGEDQKDTALVIGPGGGLDIAAAYFSGFKFIEAVEVNPSFVELMRLYNRPTFSDKDNIKIWVNEGRNFVRKNKGKYDAILLTIPVTKSTRGSDFYGLTENYLFTVEALADYLDGLTDEGILYFTMHARQEVYRMLANYLVWQQQNGINPEEAFKSTYVFSNGMNPVLVIKKQPFGRKKIEDIHLSAHILRLDMDAFFFPYLEQYSLDTIVQNINFGWYMFDDLIYDISTGKYPPNKLWEASLLNLRPVTDDSPYFFNYNRGIPDTMTIPLWLGIFIIGWFLANWRKGWQLASHTGNQPVELHKKFGVLAFMVFLLGFSYFFIQAYLFQILNLKLSSPSQSFSLLLFSFLLGNGMGSLLTKWFEKALARKLTIYTGAIIAVNLLTVYVLLPFWDTQLSEFGIATLLLLPAFFIGIPFPLLLKITASYTNKKAIPVLLGISSVAGVAASIFAIILSILYGYRFVFLLGLFGYGLLMVTAYRSKSLESEKENVQEY